MIDNPENLLNTELMPDTVALIGIPFDEYSSFLRGPAKAPSVIRQTLHNGASNLFAENGVNLDTHPLFRDLGDLALPCGEDAIAAIESAIGRLAAQKARVLALGGDHAITYPVVSALTHFYDDLTILHLDAHPDIYDRYNGSRFSHACPFARIMETGRLKRLVQVGVRGMNDEQRRQVDKFGVTCIEMKDYRSKNPIALEGPLYLSLDMDVLDPAYAPGVSHHEPGGMSTRKVLRLIQSIRCPIVGADIVEVNPDRDVNGMTAAVAAKFLKEIAGMMLQQGR
ncbi:agmatinase [uncultured Desulfosarcina sp.]|uniref:agmatinase n=1 Tax=uncultured Desulfosarcina sp. TaxID=218289 RepID=UPI0029C73163|nr:agmatinase [uncultured Desulfosarcina sp.]